MRRRREDRFFFTVGCKKKPKKEKVKSERRAKVYKKERALSEINLLSWFSPSVHEKQQSRGIFKFLVSSGNTARALVGTQTAPSQCRDG